MTVPVSGSGRVYTVSVASQARGKQRSRSTKEGHHFTPKQTVVAENWVRLCCVEQVGTPCIPGPVALRIVVVTTMPATMPREKRRQARAGETLPTKKPDWDNIAKLACDALNGVAWADDAAIARASVVKIYGDTPGMVLSWWTMGAAECQAAAAATGYALPETVQAAALGLL